MSVLFRRPRPAPGHALFAEERAKQVEFAHRAGNMLSEIAREADALNLPLLAHFATMARVEADAITSDAGDTSASGERDAAGDGAGN